MFLLEKARPANLLKVIINITVKIRQFYYDTRVEL